MTTSETIAHEPQQVLYGIDALKPQDIHAICRELKLPLPTPNTNLRTILEARSLSISEVYVRIHKSMKLDVMIAAAALQKGVKVMPKDPRLNPIPYKLRWDLTEEGKAGKPKPVQSETGMPANDWFITSIGECASAPGSKRAARYALYAIGKNVDQLKNAGVKGSDIRRHIADGLITFGPREVK